MMMRIIGCHDCKQRLTQASYVMRRHATLMHKAIELAKTGTTEKEKKDLTDGLAASFNEAQSAWDTYREHLVEHGVLPALPSTRDVA